MNGPASPANPDAPQGSAGGGGASGAPLPPAPGQPPPSTPSDSGGHPSTPVNTTKGGQPPGQPGGGTSVIPLDFAGSLRRIANINARPDEQNQHPTTQAELAHSREVVRARMAELKAKGGNVTLAEATDLDLAEKSEAAELKTKLENELRKNGQLTADQTGQLNQAKATLARHAPMDPGPPPPVPQAVNDVRNLGKRDPATLTQQEAHQLANAQRSIARKGLDNLSAITSPLSNHQKRALARFKAIADCSRYKADLPKGPPPGYNPDGNYADWYPPHGKKPVSPPDNTFTHEAQALTDSEIAADISRMKAEGHAVDRHGPDVAASQLTDRAMFKVDPMTQTKEHGTNPGNDHSCARNATQFTSERAMAQSLRAVEKSAEYRDALKKLEKDLRAGKTPTEKITVEVPLDQALGSDYLKHVRGRTRVGSVAHPTRLERTNLKDGVVFAYYLYDKNSKSYKLQTMYPDIQ